MGQQLSWGEGKEEDSLVRGISFCSAELSAGPNPCLPRHSILTHGNHGKYMHLTRPSSSLSSSTILYEEESKLYPL